MAESVAVVGAGSWGTAIATMVCPLASSVTLVARRPELADYMQRHRRNPDYVSGLELPPRLTVTSDVRAAVGAATVVVMAVPAVGFRSVYETVAEHRSSQSVTLSLAKGLEPGSRLRMSQVVEAVTPGCLVAVLTGPNLAAEVTQGFPAATVLASDHQPIADRLQAQFSSDRFRVYTNNDVTGCEIAAVTKNVIAIAVGLCDGMGLGVNARAGLITRGLAEITRLGVAMGGQPETFAGLAGLGDLVATCSSPLSRNWTFGSQLAKGRTPSEIATSNRTVAEGVASSAEVAALSSERRIEMPICETVAAVIAGERRPDTAIDDLMSRQLRTEF